jgi:hypothetical protein
MTVVRPKRRMWSMSERVKVTEAVRRTGVPGPTIFLAIAHGRIRSERDDRGYDLVNPDEVRGLATTFG